MPPPQPAPAPVIAPPQPAPPAPAPVAAAAPQPEPGPAPAPEPAPAAPPPAQAPMPAVTPRGPLLAALPPATSPLLQPTEEPAPLPPIQAPAPSASPAPRQPPVGAPSGEMGLGATGTASPAPASAAGPNPGFEHIANQQGVLARILAALTGGTRSATATAPGAGFKDGGAVAAALRVAARATDTNPTDAQKKESRARTLHCQDRGDHVAIERALCVARRHGEKTASHKHASNRHVVVPTRAPYRSKGVAGHE